MRMPVGVGSDALRFAVAAMAGLAVVGIVLLGVSMITGRRRPQTATATEPATSKGRVSPEHPSGEKPVCLRADRFFRV